MKFTDKGVVNLKPAPTRRIIWEENGFGQGSLGLRITPSGTKTWIYMYRHAGKPRMQTLGVYPAVSVAEAHKAFGDAMLAHQTGLDPAFKSVTEHKREREAPTFNALAEAYIEGYAKKRKRTWAEDERILKRDVLPKFGSHKAQAIERRDVRKLLDEIVARGAPIGANRTLAVVRKLFNWAVSRDLVPNNPCVGVGAPSEENQRDRVLTESEIRTVLVNLPTMPVTERARLALLLQLLTAQRCGEILGAEWAEFDLPAAWWTIPAGKAKNKLTHRVPLSPLALLVLAHAKAIGHGSRYVFASPRGDKPMVETVLARGVHRNLELLGVPHFTPHDLRRTAASHMTGMRISRLVVSKILNHVESGVTAVYDRHSYDHEKREALDLWAQKLDELGFAASLDQNEVKVAGQAAAG